MTAPSPQWLRLSPRMLLVHPVHEVARQIPVLVGSVVLGSATGNPLWAVAALVVTVGVGVARWFTTTYRIDAEEVQLRAGCCSGGYCQCPQQDSIGVDGRTVAAPVARADGAAGEHRPGGAG